MNAKTYFRRIRDTERRIEALKAKRQHIQDLAYGNTRFASSGIRSTTGNHSRIEAAVVRLLDMDDQIGRELQACTAQIAEASALISRIPDECYRELLSMRYISCLRWEVIARRMNYSTAHLFRLHGFALREADRILRQRGATHEADSSMRGAGPVRGRDRGDGNLADHVQAKAHDAGDGKAKGGGAL